MTTPEAATNADPNVERIEPDFDPPAIEPKKEPYGSQRAVAAVVAAVVGFVAAGFVVVDTCHNVTARRAARAALLDPAVEPDCGVVRDMFGKVNFNGRPEVVDPNKVDKMCRPGMCEEGKCPDLEECLESVAAAVERCFEEEN